MLYIYNNLRVTLKSFNVHFLLFTIETLISLRIDIILIIVNSG